MGDKITKSPNIRFAGFTDAWEQRKLGEIGEFKNGMNFGKEAMGHGHPFVNLQDIFGKNIVDDSNLGLAESSENQRKEYCLNKGDVLFIRSSVKPEGVGEAALVPRDFLDTTYSGFIIRFRPKVKVADKFKKFVFSTKEIRNQIMASATSSANTNINQDSLQKIQLKLPDNEEQEKIGAFFDNLDNIITLHQRKLDLLKVTKKSMLQKMFPKDGESVPEIRFAGFTDLWEQRKFEDIFKLSQGLQIPISQRFLTEGANKYFYITNEFLKSSCDEKYYIENPPQSVICNKEDILMTRTGNTGIVVTDVEGCFHNNFFKIQYDKELLDKYFIVQLLSTESMKRRILNSAGSSTIPDLSHKSFYKLDSIFPKIDEQKKISEFILGLDKIITLHQSELDLLKDLKKSMLQQMFI